MADDAEAVAGVGGTCVVGVAWAVVVGVTAAAATTAYLAGRATGRGCGGRPALRILDIGCCAKFGFGGGLDA